MPWIFSKALPLSGVKNLVNARNRGFFMRLKWCFDKCDLTHARAFSNITLAKN